MDETLTPKLIGIVISLIILGTALISYRLGDIANSLRKIANKNDEEDEDDGGGRRVLVPISEQEEPTAISVVEKRNNVIPFSKKILPRQ